MLEKKSLPLLSEAFDKLQEGFSSLYPFNHAKNLDIDAVRRVLLEVAHLMHDDFPYHHPLYAGQMLKTPHPVARLAYSLAMYTNPNNHDLDTGKASTAMEKEAVQEIAHMFGWKNHLGHLCSGGTMANLEALWISGLVMPNKIIVSSEQAHYTHQRISNVLKIPFEKIACNASGKMYIDELEQKLQTGKIGTVVATLGTTSTGAVDPLAEILKLRLKYDFRIHVDAAYGGYFMLANNLAFSAQQAFDLLTEVDSIVIDPHKHGLQPFGCGCVLFKDPAIGRFYKHDSPYTYFTSKELHLGEISLECSRPGAAAVALWATQRLLPLTKDGEFAKDISKSRKAALILYEKLKNDNRFFVIEPPELDIVVWTVKSESPEKSSALALKIFEQAASEGLHLATTRLPVYFIKENHWKNHQQTKQLICLRSCLQKPDHVDYIELIWAILTRAADHVLEQTKLFNDS
eukprot:gene20385-26455_t